MPHLASCTRFFALPALAFVLAAPPAAAQIVYTNVADTTTLSNEGSVFFALDVGGGNPGSASTTYFAALQFALSFEGYVLNKPQFVLRGGNSAMHENGLKKLSLNAPIGPEFSWYIFPSDFVFRLNGEIDDSNWAPGTTGYVGLRVGAGGGDYRYGWAQISYNSDRSITLYDLAYEQSLNTAIQAGAGAIPEPSTYAVLAGIVAAGAAFYARRRDRLRSPSF